MKMRNLYLLLLSFSALIAQCRAETCEACTTAYEATDKTCGHVKTYLGCLETASPPCSLTAEQASALATGYDAVKESCSLTETCTCQMEYWKTSSTLDATVECSADKSFLACMKGKGGNSCADRTRTELMTNLQYADGCIAADSACSCEKIYAETDITPETKCAADTAFVTCLIDKTGSSCTGQSPSQLVTDHSITDDCLDTLTDTCRCEIEYAKQTGDTCGADKSFLACMKGKGGNSCAGSTRTELMTGRQYDDGCIAADSACSCEKIYAETDITPETKCAADTAFVTCLIDKTGSSCTGQSPSQLVTDHSITDDCLDTLTDTCRCEIEYAKQTGDKCGADKSFLACMKGKGGNSCAGSTRTELMTGRQYDDGCIAADSACSCEKIYAETDITETKCAADTAFMTCMIDKTGNSCTGQSPSKLVTDHSISDDCLRAAGFGDDDEHWVFTYPGNCRGPATSTCKCFIDYLKKNITGTNKCLAQRGFITCMKGKTELQCDGVKTANDVSGFPAIDSTCIGEKETAACGCDEEYAHADVTGVDVKCNADVHYMMCLKDKTTITCNGSPASQSASIHVVASSCLVKQTDTCRCEIEHAKRDVEADKCGANKAFMTCLKTTTEVSCDTTTTAQQVVAAVKSALTDCELGATCSCEVAYAEADRANSKCQADTNLIHCLRGVTDTGCVNATTVFSLVDMVEADTECEKSSLCQCEMAYTKGDKSTASGHCSNARSLLACSYDVEDSVKSCNGGSKANLLDFAKSIITSQIENCKLTDTCQCEELTKVAKPAACSDLKAGITCLQTAVNFGCNGVKTVKVLAEEIVQKINGECVTGDSLCQCEMAYATSDRTTSEKQCKADTDFFACVKTNTGTSCSDQTLSQMVTAHAYEDGCPSGTCKCLIDYMKTANGSDTCDAQKNFITCMKGKTDLQCDGVKKANDVTGFPTLEDSCIGDAVSDTCGCEKEYVLADLTEDKCSADRSFLQCLMEKTTPSCSDTQPHVLASNHPIDDQCWDTFSDTCKCEIQLARNGVEENSKCGSYLAFVSCLKSAIGKSCDGAKSAHELVTAAKAKMGTCEPSPTCQCELSYAENDKSTNTSKCLANKALISCLRNQTSTGCLDTTTVASLVAMATETVPGCDHTSLCKCEAVYARGEKVDPANHCSNAKGLLVCLYDEADTVRTCNDGSKADLEVFTRTLISSTIADCSLDDTCQCEEDMLDGTCSKLKKGISCLKTATSKGCNGEKIVKTIATETNVKITALESCALSTACQCELDYTSADVSSTTKTCSAAKTLKTCLQQTESSKPDLKGCDDTTDVTKIVTDVADKVIEAKCSAMQQSVLSSLLLVVSLTTMQILTG